MDKKDKSKKVTREFKPTTFSLRNKSTIFLITMVLAIFGILSYNTMPVESFPEVSFAYIFVKTVYPGNSPIDIENLITRPLEKEIHAVTGIKVMNSTSTQDNSDIFIEFNPDVDISKALQDVKDAVDNAKGKLPNDLPSDPFVMDIDVNEFPIININLGGDYSLDELKGFAEYLEDEIEGLSEISKVKIKGLNEREIQINVDQYKLDAFELNFGDIEGAITSENISISGGDIKLENTTRSIRTIGEFTSIQEIENIIVKHEKGNIVYLKDVAKVIDGYEDPLTFARLDRQPVVSLQVVKKSGENLLTATEKIFKILVEAKGNKILPDNLNINLSNDQSDFVKKMVNNLENSIIMGIIFVTLVLFFFLGLRNAVIVGMAIPMSMFLSFLILNVIGSTINMMVLFGMVLALGMLVDNSIVVVENSYRFYHQGYNLFESVRLAVGEIAIPIIASTATTLGAFFPLVFWPGIMGEFMSHLPITLIIVLGSSLFVALIIIPVLVKSFIKPGSEIKAPEKRRTFKRAAICIAGGILFYGIKFPVLGTLLFFTALLMILNQFALYSASVWFQEKFLVRLEKFYLNTIKFSLKGKHPKMILGGTVVFFLLTMMFFMARHSKVELFPPSEPLFINVFAEHPVGTDITATNEFMKKLEDRIFELTEPYKGIIKSILITVGKGVAGENEFPPPVGNTPNKGMVTISFVDFEKRNGIKTSDIMKLISTELIGQYPGVQISTAKNAVGPPIGRPINLEITGENFEKLLLTAESIRQYLDSKNVQGVEGLKMDLDTGSPELIVKIDREKARRFGLSTGQIASTLRTALFGKEISDFKDGEDEFPIWLRLDKKYRNNITALMNQKVTFRSQSTGKIMQVPISAVAEFSNSTTYASVNRKDMDRVITLYSSIVEGANTASIVAKMKKIMAEYKMPEGIEYKFTGEQEDVEETQQFLIQAMSIAIALILIILVTQFNSFAKTFIIIATVFFSTIGVFGGLAIFKMDFIIIMTGIGIISLAGVVVNNAIVLIDYIDYLRANKKLELGLTEDDHLPIDQSLECIIQGGKTRLRPVLLTAITTILGLMPMASGININFSTLLTRLDPQIYFGGNNAAFWGPMAWAVIFGLSFATFLTLILVPVMYYLGNRLKIRLREKKAAQQTV